jgi:dihydroxyacetone kinase-like predicted kinase
MSSFNYNNIKNIIKSASYSVINEYEYIDKLNVFPVPDGDTGTNLKMTLLGALDYLNPVEDLEQMLKDYSRGLLMNARGNSGAIFSQIIRGFSQTFIGIKGESVQDPKIIIKAFANAKEVSYKSVLAPVEGTMLTVIRMTSEKLIANESKYKNVNEVFADAAIFAKEALDQTPKMLKILEEAKLVDSGGYGL